MTAVSLILVLVAQLLATAGAEEVLFAEEGGQVTLKPAGVDASMYLYWKHDKHTDDLACHHPLKDGWSLTTDESWQNRLSVSGFALTVKQIQKEDFGTFTLFQGSGPGKRVNVNSFKLINVNVSKTGGSLLLPGESLTLTCVVDTPQGYGAPETYWLNPQGKKHGNARGGKLTKSVTNQDNGRWSCVVVNRKKEHKVQISVTVFDLAPPPVQSQYTSDISPLTIPCSFNVSWEQVKAKGVQEVHWHYLPKGLAPTDSQRLFDLSLDEPLTWKADRGRGLSPVPDPGKGNLSLTRKRGRAEDRGDYVCTFRFKGGVTLKRTVQVQVLQITSSPGTELISGQSVNLTCGLGHALASDLHLKWIPPERSSLRPLKSGNFFIPEVASGQSGKWGCELWRNNTRLTSAVITLKIEPKLSVWMLVTICGATAIGVLLLALVFIIYRRRNRKTRLLRHRLCQCKNPKPKGFYRT